ncbi:putative transporter SVOPL isoform X1 [Paramacrobiotus metropolitanus]|uniref:putative transporter SVOPL isoform X1 n=1 Tax=Paramacrobiotus metropolitanus TaxID=2943436 RepID=UPI002445ECA0|nr:putative transporter SVOPL isoform X1 [Paramacrobiotus metropolitanus]
MERKANSKKETAPLSTISGVENAAFEGAVLEESTSASEGYTVDEALNKIGFGRYQIKMTCVIGFFGVADALEVMLLSVLSPVLRCEWNLSEWDVATVSTVVFAGMLVFSPLWGKMSDNFGRWPTLFVVMFLLGWFGLLTSFSPTYSWLLFLRMIVGGAASGTGQSFILYAEMLPPKHRGKMLVLTQLFWATGSFILIAAAAIIIPWLGWRYLTGFTAILSWLSLCFFRLVPESPRFLLGKGRLLEATTLLARIAKVNKTQLPKGHLIVPPTQMQGKISDMLSKNYRRLTLQLWVVWFCMTFGYYGVVLSSTEIVERARICDLSGQIVNQGEAVAVEDCGCRPLSGDDYMTLIVGTLGEFGSLFINAALMDLIGRKLTFVVNLLCCAFFVLMLNICTSRFVLSMFILCARMFMSAIGNCVYVYTSEVYPTTFRAVGLGVCSSVARIGSMISPFIAQVLLARSLPAGLGVYAVIMLITALNCLLLPIETKGKNLEETAVLH